ncbi:hypothetical protein OEZ85_003385 [Tetradesmus obliquus]|uniref:Uncharacterized protein n=1 Tax=Tetradesmus obliquus TaxID=3088 RepID=A0ABY8UB44_TETOB|nr:hypothetical protein OEZ85_003385 [Tetradesmus obliquus]
MPPNVAAASETIEEAGCLQQQETGKTRRWLFYTKAATTAAVESTAAETNAAAGIPAGDAATGSHRLGGPASSSAAAKT